VTTTCPLTGDGHTFASRLLLEYNVPGCDYLVTGDDRLVRQGERLQEQGVLTVHLINPVDFVQEV
jgi:hypothetical protein